MCVSLIFIVCAILQWCDLVIYVVELNNNFVIEVVNFEYYE